MSVDELRTRFAELAGSVVPDEDPYGQLMRRARRRRTRRTGVFAALAALLATFLAGQTVLGLGAAGPERRPDQRRTEPADGFRVDSEWTWKLVNAPTRGNLADDQTLVTDLARAFDKHRAEFGVSAALPRVRILFAEDLTNRRVVVAVYHSGSAAALVSRTGGQGVPAEDLFGSGVSTGPQRVEPFTVVQRTTGGATRTAAWAAPWLLGLAPPGCEIRSGLGQFGPDGTVKRTSDPAATGDYLLLTPDGYGRTLAVACAGVRRYQGVVGYRVDEIADPAMSVPPATAAQGVTNEDSVLAARQAGAAYGPLVRAAGLRGGDLAEQQPVIRWSGLVPGPAGLTPAALLLPAAMAGPAVLCLGTGERSLVALAGRAEVDRLPAPPGEDGTVGHPGDPSAPGGQGDHALLSTGMAASTGLIGIRLPERDGDRAVLGDRVLVVGPDGAVSVDAVDASGRTVRSVRLDGVAAVLTVPFGTRVTLRALDATGNPLVTTPLNDPLRGGRLFDLDLFHNW